MGEKKKTFGKCNKYTGATLTLVIKAEFGLNVSHCLQVLSYMLDSRQISWIDLSRGAKKKNLSKSHWGGRGNFLVSS